LLTEKPVVAEIDDIANGSGFQMCLVSDLRVGDVKPALAGRRLMPAFTASWGSY